MFIWLSGISPVYLLGTVSGLFPVTAAGSTFFSGFMFLLNLVLLSFFGLLLAYFRAEQRLADYFKNSARFGISGASAGCGGMIDVGRCGT